MAHDEELNPEGGSSIERKMKKRKENTIVNLDSEQLKERSEFIGDLFSYKNEFTGKLSDIIRQLALAALAIVWIFRSATTIPNALPKVPSELVLPAYLVVIGLIFDVMQYLYLGTAYWLYAIYREKKISNQNFQKDQPHSLNAAGYVFFYFKTASILAAYFFILKYLARLI